MVGCVAVIGAGVVGGSIVRCLLKSAIVDRVIATRHSMSKLRPLRELGAEVSDDNLWASEEADIVFICVKPGDVKGVLEEISENVKGKILISTAAIVSLDFYYSHIPDALVVRTMPNVAAIVGESFTAFTCGDNLTEEEKGVVWNLLETMGICMEVEEKYMDAITGLSGSGPAYVAIVIDALLYAGLKVGLPRELALFSAAQSVLGAAKLILEGELTPAAIEEMVTTPGGTTIDGIYEIEDGKLRTALMNAVEAATRKCENIRRIWNSSEALKQG
ncbi:MAG: pyrroline-5-carboxylate reductase [Candidatus Bathyarchaeia archaeon]